MKYSEEKMKKIHQVIHFDYFVWNKDQGLLYAWDYLHIETCARKVLKRVGQSEKKLGPW